MGRVCLLWLVSHGSMEPAESPCCSPPPRSPPALSGPTLSFNLQRCSTASPLAAQAQQVVTAVQQAALGAGAATAPTVAVTEEPPVGCGRRRLAAASSPEGTALLVTVRFAAGEAGPAQQLGVLLLSQPTSVLPAEQFGGVAVIGVQLDGTPLAGSPPAPSPKSTLGTVAGVAGGAAAAGLTGALQAALVLMPDAGGTAPPLPLRPTAPKPELPLCCARSPGCVLVAALGSSTERCCGTGCGNVRLGAARPGGAESRPPHYAVQQPAGGSGPQRAPGCSGSQARCRHRLEQQHQRHPGRARLCSCCSRRARWGSWLSPWGSALLLGSGSGSRARRR